MSDIFDTLNSDEDIFDTVASKQPDIFDTAAIVTRFCNLAALSFLPMSMFDLSTFLYSILNLISFIRTII